MVGAALKAMAVTLPYELDQARQMAKLARTRASSTQHKVLDVKIAGALGPEIATMTS